MIKNKKFFEPNLETSSTYEKAINENYKKLKSIKRSSNLRELKSK